MARITAHFPDRDSAGQSLLRLRRSGVDFDLIRLTDAAERAPEAFAALNRATAVAAPARLELSVKASHLERAWDVLRAAGAQNIRSVT